MSDVAKLLGLLKGHIPAYILAVVLLSVGTLSFLLVPPQIGQLVGGLSDIMDGNTGSQIWIVISIISGLLILQALCTALHAFIIANTSEKIINKLRQSFFASVIAQPLDGGKTQTSGEIASEFASDLVIIQDGVADTLVSFLRNALASIGAFVALMLISIKITIITLVGISLITLVILTFIRMATRSIMSVQEYRAKTVSLLLEASSNAYVIQAYHRNDYMNKRFGNTIDSAFGKVRRHLLLMSWVSPISLIIFSIVMGASMAYGVKEIAAGAITMEQFVTYITYAVLLVASVSQVGMLIGRMKQGAVMYVKHQHRFDYDKAQKAAIDKDQPQVTQMKGRSPIGIQLTDVNFSYRGQTTRTLSDISMHLKAGEICAIVGQSGAGKSTVAGLLCGLFTPQSGVIEFVDQSKMPVQAFPPPKDCIAIVPQEPFLLSGSFAENITFGRDNICESKIKAVAKLARIDDFIKKQEGGYAGLLQEGGSNLSRGQRQRIAIARALAGDPKVLILDEATASLDVVSERAIKNLVAELKGKVTVIIIAHQGQLLNDVDNLIVLNRGEIEFTGDPKTVDTGSLTQHSFAKLICENTMM